MENEPVTNSDSILNDIKKLCSIDVSQTDFDRDIIIHINSAFANLRQLGIGPEIAFRIKNDKQTWKDILKDDVNSESLKDYIYIKCRLIFDTPQSSAMENALKEELREIEWRLRTYYNEELKKEN